MLGYTVVSHNARWSVRGNQAIHEGTYTYPCQEGGTYPRGYQAVLYSSGEGGIVTTTIYTREMSLDIVQSSAIK